MRRNSPESIIALLLGIGFFLAVFYDHLPLRYIYPIYIVVYFSLVFALTGFIVQQFSKVQDIYKHIVFSVQRIYYSTVLVLCVPLVYTDKYNPGYILIALVAALLGLGLAFSILEQKPFLLPEPKLHYILSGLLLNLYVFLAVNTIIRAAYYDFDFDEQSDGWFIYSMAIITIIVIFNIGFHLSRNIELQLIFISCLITILWMFFSWSVLLFWVEVIQHLFNFPEGDYVVHLLVALYFFSLPIFYQWVHSQGPH